MSNATLVNLATVGSDELHGMPVAVFTAGLDQMSSEAIVRFRRMRKLSAQHRQALEKYLVEHPDKRPGGGGAGSTETDADDPRDTKKAASGKSPKSGEAGFVMELLLRLIAWWEGMDTDDVARAKGVTRKKKKKKSKAAAAPAPKPVAPAAPVVAAPEPEPMPMSRTEIIQKLWGEGFNLPGGDAFALRIASPVDFNPAGIYLDLAPGLGGAARAISATHGVTIRGLESDPELAAEAQAISERLGVADKVVIRGLGYDGIEPEDFEPRGEHAAVFMREAMFAVEERARMLNVIADALSANGSLVLTDFVLAEDIEEGEEIAAWRATEPDTAQPWTEAEYRSAFKVFHYKLDRFDDLTAEYLPFIHAAWRKLHDCLQNAKLPPETAATLIREGNVWLARSRALETGQLRFVHMHAVLQRTEQKTGEAVVEERDIAVDELADEEA